jgi:hypothetical protein
LSFAGEAPIDYAQHMQSAQSESNEVAYMASDEKDFAVSLVINVHGSTSSKKQIEEIAEGLLDELQASFDAELPSGITGDCTFNVDNLVDQHLASSGKAMTLQQLEEYIGDHMEKLEQPTDPREPISIRMSDGNPLTGARVFRSAKGSGWEVWLSDAERL